MSIQKASLRKSYSSFYYRLGLIRTQRLELAHVAISAAAASILVLLSSLLPAEYTRYLGGLDANRWLRLLLSAR